MLNLLHLSDLHFGPPFVPAVADALQRTVRQLELDILVVTGDLTQRATEDQFMEARAWLDSLTSVPRVTVPGNHDVPLYRLWERMIRPYDLYRRHISEDLDTVVYHDHAVIVALNSTNPHRAIVNGRIHQSQLEFCIQAFESAPPDAVRIVAAHHHFAPAPDYAGGQVMPKAKRALDMFTRLNVELILAGHLHRAYVGNSLDVYPGENREHGIIIVQCGTSTSQRGRVREREKNSFNLVQIDAAFIKVRHFMYFDDQDAFLPVSRYEFARPTRRYLDKDVSLFSKL